MGGGGLLLEARLSVAEALVTPQTGSGENTRVLPETAAQPPPALYRDLKKQPGGIDLATSQHSSPIYLLL